MTAFTAATLAAFIGANGCIPPKAADFFIDIAQGESGLIDTAINDNTAVRSYYPATTAEAVRLASSLIAQGHVLAAGIGQVRSTNWEWTGLTVETVFDPCRNLAAALRVNLAVYGGATHPATQIAYSGSVLARLVRKGQRPVKEIPKPVASTGSPFIQPSRTDRDRTYSLK